jgi:hypothetical protein
MRTRAQNSVRGRQNKATGDAFEAWIDNQHALAGQLGILAHVVHNEAHSKVVGGQLIFTAAGVADYSGVLHGGKYVAIEAKSTADDRLARSAVTQTQQNHLTAVANAGGLALLLVEFRSSELTRIAVPWLEVPWKVLRTAESVSKAELLVQRWAAQPDNCYLARFHHGSTNRYIVGSATTRKRIHPRE